MTDILVVVLIFALLLGGIIYAWTDLSGLIADQLTDEQWDDKVGAPVVSQPLLRTCWADGDTTGRAGIYARETDEWGDAA